jgi:hypothetical protein
MSTAVNTRLAPVAIGGVGGSGTRLIATILRHLDYYLGDDLNLAGDNLWFTLLFKRSELWESGASAHDFACSVRVFCRAMVGGEALTEEEEVWVRSFAQKDRPQYTTAWLRARGESLAQAARGASRSGPWGWKEPNTHIFLDRLATALPGLRYIHVMRNGLDMAYSANQSQLRLWGRYFLGTDRYEESPRWSLKYWCCVHRRIGELVKEMPGRFLLLNYDHFCAFPDRGLRELLRFLGVTAIRSAESALLPLVSPPDSIGRFRRLGLEPFDPEDVAYARSLGFDTETPVCDRQRMNLGSTSGLSIESRS